MDVNRFDLVIIGGSAAAFAGTPEDAPEAQRTVAAVKGSFELVQERLERTGPPHGL